jgi:hypothetical protein
VLRDMTAADHPAWCRRFAARLGLDKTTVWRWRTRILAALERASWVLGWVVETDQTIQQESQRSVHEWINDLHAAIKSFHSTFIGPARRYPNG